MKLRNKKTREIVEVTSIDVDSPTKGIMGFESFDRKGSYSSLAELNEEWEDYEEPKEYWCITGRGNLHYLQDMTDENDKDHREIGNYFETEEEAEKAVEKLKAWKRLNDKGFSIYSWDYGFDMVDKPAQTIILKATAVDANNNDLDLLFGGEE